ncbi:MAG: hypothetical protein JSS84_02660 [Bacteroidetes bacterium]|nr:hypothetical protein [Bacteroidota bacterium]
MSHGYRRIEGRDQFIRLQASFGAVELGSLLKAMGLEHIRLMEAGLITYGPIDTATNCEYRPTAKGKRYFVNHPEFEAILLRPGKGMALLRALEKAPPAYAR